MMRFASVHKMTSKGFTLVEMLVYIAIFTVVSTASVAFLLSLNDLIGQYKVETALYRSGTNAMEQILLSIRQADQVDLLNTTLETPGAGKLTVENDVSSTVIELNAGTLELTIDGDDLGSLLSDTVTVEEFTVYHYPMSRGEYVRVKLRLSATVDSLTKTITLYGGAVVRGAI